MITEIVKTFIEFQCTSGEDVLVNFDAVEYVSRSGAESKKPSHSYSVIHFYSGKKIEVTMNFDDVWADIEEFYLAKKGVKGVGESAS